VVVAQRAAVKDLYDAVDFDVRTAEGVVIAQAHDEMVGVRDLSNDRKSPDREFVDRVVLIVADD
jgi:hypothetical protein